MLSPHQKATGAASSAKPTPSRAAVRSVPPTVPLVAQLVQGAAVLLAVGGMALVLLRLLQGELAGGLAAFTVTALAALLFFALGSLLQWVYGMMLHLRAAVQGRGELRG